MKDIVVFSNGPDESTVSELWGEIFESAQALVRESSTALTNVTDACEERALVYQYSGSYQILGHFRKCASASTGCPWVPR